MPAIVTLIRESKEADFVESHARQERHFDSSVRDELFQMLKEDKDQVDAERH